MATLCVIMDSPSSRRTSAARTVSAAAVLLLLLLFSRQCDEAKGFSFSSSFSRLVKDLGKEQMGPSPRHDRSSFLRQLFGIMGGPILVGSTAAARAIEFVPASPYFEGTYRDAVDIVHAQRLALDNIGAVVADGNLEEAGFKAMQLSAQTRTAGKIILDTFQERISDKKGSGGNDGALALLRYLSCQKKLASLLDLCDECDASLRDAVRAGRTGGGGMTAAAQLKTTKVVDETKSAYDDFLSDVRLVEGAIANETK